MVLQALADAGQIMVDLDAMLSQLRRRADAGDHQELRRLDGAGGEDDLTCADRLLDAVDAAGDADGPLALEPDARDLGVGLDLEIRSRPGGLQVAGGTAAASAAADGELEVADAFLARTVEVVVPRQAGLARPRR